MCGLHLHSSLSQNCSRSAKQNIIHIVRVFWSLTLTSIMGHDTHLHHRSTQCTQFVVKQRIIMITFGLQIDGCNWHCRQFSMCLSINKLLISTIIMITSTFIRLWNTWKIVSDNWLSLQLGKNATSVSCLCITGKRGNAEINYSFNA